MPPLGVIERARDGRGGACVGDAAEAAEAAEAAIAGRGLARGAVRRGGDIQPPPVGLRHDHPKTLVTATVDRPLHHAHIVLSEGASYRLARDRRQGVIPLT